MAYRFMMGHVNTEETVFFFYLLSSVFKVRQLEEDQ